MEAIPAYTGLTPVTFFNLLALLVAVYHLVSGMFAAPESHGSRDYVPMEPMPQPVQLGDVTEEELKAYDGTNPKKPLLADVIKKLLNDKPELITEVDILHRTPLHIAALFPAELVKGVMSHLFPRYRKKIRLIGDMLIRKDRLSCYTVDENKQSALHVAAKEGNAPLVKVILNYSSDCLEMVDNDGRNALHLAVKNAPQIYERVGGYDLKTIISLVTSKRLINCVDKNGQTALNIAVEEENKDPQLYMGIKTYLKKCGATKKTLDTDSTTIPPTEASTTKWKSEFISISAVLIATVAFAVAFTMPGGIDPKGQGPPTPILINTYLFKVFVIFDTVAFCYSIASAFLCNLAVFASKVEDSLITQQCFIALWIALTSLSLTFGAAIHLVVASKSLWLAVLVWVMVCILPICIRIMSLEGKLHLFTPRERYIHIVLGESIALVLFVFSPIALIAGVVCSGIILPSLRSIRKKLYGIKSKILNM